MPDGIADRNADVWEALISVADAAGGDWPERVRVAAVALVAASSRGEGSLGIRLLTDIKTVFGDRDAMRTKELLQALINMDESVWADLKGTRSPTEGWRLSSAPYEMDSTASASGIGMARAIRRNSSMMPGSGICLRPPWKPGQAGQTGQVRQVTARMSRMSRM